VAELLPSKLSTIMLESLPDIGPCLRWPGKYKSDGYGLGPDGKNVSAYIYRLYHPNDKYEVVDHLCNNEWCFALYHLDGVTHKINEQRKRADWYCQDCGGELVRFNGDKKRRCKTCRRKYLNAYLKQYRLSYPDPRRR